MRRIAFMLCLFCLSLLVHAGNDKALLDSGNTAFAKKEYAKAITSYEKLLSDGVEAPELYYNLGNAYFKSKNMPMAILNYERAKKLNSEDEDIDFNLKIANTLITDKIEGGQTHLISGWKNRIFNLFSEQTWSRLSILAFIIFLGFLLAFIISGRILLRKISLGLSFCFLLLTAGNYLIARSKYKTAETHSEAIVMTPNVTAKGSPDEKGTDLFILHEGTKVTLLQSNSGWSEVRLANGNTGWLPQAVFTII